MLLAKDNPRIYELIDELSAWACIGVVISDMGNNTSDMSNNTSNMPDTEKFSKINSLVTELEMLIKEERNPYRKYERERRELRAERVERDSI